MSDPMEDEKLIDAVAVAISGAPFASSRSKTKAGDAVRAILNAGYRIVKPDAEWADFSAYVPGDDDLPGYRAVHADGDREFAIETILQDSDETHDLFETMTVPVSRTSLIAELESMKEDGE